MTLLKDLLHLTGSFTEPLLNAVGWLSSGPPLPTEENMQLMQY